MGGKHMSAKKIVIVDDDPFSIKTLQDVLSQNGYNVALVLDGLTALERITSDPPDLVISDMLLPGLHGFELCRKIRQDALLKDVAVIFLTGVYKTTRYSLEAKKCGAAAFFTKPYDLSEIVQTVEALIGVAELSQTAGDLDEEARRQLDELCRQYARALPAKLEELREIWNMYSSEQHDGKVLRKLFVKVHALAGTGASFGFTCLSEAAQRCERLLDRFIERDRPLSARECAQIEGFCRDLHESAVQNDSAGSRLQLGGTRRTCWVSNAKKIFLVDDDLELTRYLAFQLEIFGYHVCQIHGLDEFQSRLKDETPDVILMDVLFPEENRTGTAFITQLRESEKGLSIPVVFLSVRGDLKSRLDAVRCGCDAFFSKPLDVNGLLDKLDDLTSSADPEAFRVLLVDDEPALTGLYGRILEESGMIVREVNHPMEVMGPLVEFNPELIVMDLYMSECSGLELAKVIRQHEAYLSVPIVFLSSETNRDRQIEVMQEGADDFLIKPIESRRLVESVAFRAKRFRELREQIVRDGLTGLLNHSGGKERLDVEIERARRNQSHLCVAMIDVDHFKQVNDRFGHTFGDRVLKNLSRIMVQRLRKIDVVCRYGGEEFLAILPDTGSVQAEKVLDDIRARFEQFSHGVEEGDLGISFSCGIANYPDFRNAAALIDAADTCLYRAKADGRGRTVRADSNIGADDSA